MTPLLVRIPWSHYCRKAEWGLSQCGVPYAALDIGLGAMRRWMPALPGGTVPVLRTDDGDLCSSDAILAWADAHRDADAPALYPRGHARAVRAWEAWTDEAEGPLARREAYRCIHARPGQYGRRHSLHLLFRLARPQVLGVLKFYKTRRFDEEDRAAVPEVLDRIGGQLDKAGTGYLFTDHATAADIATAALWVPMLSIRDHPARDHPHWDNVAAFVRRVTPDALTRTRRRWARRRDLAAWQAA